LTPTDGSRRDRQGQRRGWAKLDVVLLVASHAPFQWLFVVSNLGKILSGYIGGVASFGFGKGSLQWINPYNVVSSILRIAASIFRIAVTDLSLVLDFII
jgi:hypothetical protein